MNIVRVQATRDLARCATPEEEGTQYEVGGVKAGDRKRDNVFVNGG